MMGAIQMVGSSIASGAAICHNQRLVSKCAGGRGRSKAPAKVHPSFDCQVKRASILSTGPRDWCHGRFAYFFSCPRTRLCSVEHAYR
jgi:hypothetical protein